MRVVMPMQLRHGPRQMRGPFPPSTHRHRLVAVDAGRTEVVGKVETWLQPHILSGAVDLAVWFGLRLMSGFRVWNTGPLLEGTAA